MADTDDETQNAPAEDEQPVAEATPEDAASEPAASEEVADAAGGEAQAAPAPATEPVEQLTPKQRKRQRRTLRSPQAKPPRTPEERHAERVAERRTKAVERSRRRQQERAKAAARRAAAPESAQSAELPPVHAPTEGIRKTRQGIVVSDKAAKTITVRIDVARRHRRYEKIVRSSSTVHAHDENNEAHEGDVVRVIESRPLSRTKRWALVDVLERAR
jgi:small subunit ribosomal protein S17